MVEYCRAGKNLGKLAGLCTQQAVNLADTERRVSAKRDKEVEPGGLGGNCGMQGTRYFRQGAASGMVGNEDQDFLACNRDFLHRRCDNFLNIANFQQFACLASSNYIHDNLIEWILTKRQTEKIMFLGRYVQPLFEFTELRDASGTLKHAEMVQGIIFCRRSGRCRIDDPYEFLEEGKGFLSMNVVHVTHETVEKVGGIGAVIAGLVTAEAYAKEVKRTILVGPLLQTDKPVNLRLGENSKIIYSSLDAVYTSPWRERFQPIERTYDVGIIYGNRRIQEPCNGKSVEVEVLVVDVFHSNRDRLNLFKAELFVKFNVPSAQFEHIWEYEEYVRLAEPAIEALGALGCFEGGQQVVLLAHEYMGMPTALKAVLDGKPNTRTVFYAHEVAAVRQIIEKTPGHDTMFYNVLRAGMREGRTLEEIFPQVSDNYKHPLVKAARYCDHIFAVGDYVVEELKFLDPHFRTMAIDLVYNGLPTQSVTLDKKKASLKRMKTYAANLFGKRPSWIFTHVARPVLSKGIWRDLGVLHHMDEMLAKKGETAVYFLLGTLAGQRRPQDIRHMERVYGWPVTHEKGYPDLCGGEEVLGDMIDNFNRNHSAVRAVLVNQWDWNSHFCGHRMPDDITFTDIRCGTDVEFGLSVYEPYGISQFEPLNFGALCVVSNVCGCMGNARRAAGGQAMDNNIIEADYLRVGDDLTLEQLHALPTSQRDKIESEENIRLSKLIFDCLPRDEGVMKSRIDSGYALAAKMSWEYVMKEYFMPGLNRAAER